MLILVELNVEGHRLDSCGEDGSTAGGPAGDHHESTHELLMQRKIVCPLKTELSHFNGL